jgi:hypothetical protein
MLFGVGFFLKGAYMSKALGKAVACPQRSVQVLPVQKTGGAVPALAGLCKNFCSVADIGVGVYEITLNIQQPGVQMVVGSVTLKAAGIAVIDPANTTALKIRVNTFAVDGVTATDLDFDLVAYVCNAADLLS